MGQLTSAVEHTSTVMGLVHEYPRMPPQIEKPIAYSWLRCANEHRMRPDAAIDPAVLERHQLRERQQRLDELVTIARAEMDSLYEQIAGSGYALLLTDADGVILGEKTDPLLREDFRHAGLVAGADWSEAHEGTNGIGTCIAERRPITIHLGDHFMSRHIALSCSAAPIRDPAGELIAVLDASCVGCNDSKASRMHTVALVHLSARLIEKCLFLRRHREHDILRFHSRPELVNLLHDGALAVDGGRIVAADDAAVALLARDAREQLIGRPLTEIFGMREGEAALAAGLRQPIVPLRDIVQGRRYYACLHAAPRAAAPRAALATDRRAAPTPRYSLTDLAGSDPAMLRNLRCALRIADSRVSVLIHGATGSGKEAFARALHEASARADQPFVAVNCAAIPETLIESELFGYKAGAFTGARREGMRGRIQQASGGTLFLDEIGDMPLPLQTRLLRVLEEQEVTPLGGEQTVRVDLRVISASHRNLREMIAEGRFREDLFYRLNGITLSLPALRERADLDALIQRVLAEEAGERAVRIDAGARALLLRHAWPGNLRELRNVIRTALAIAENDVIGCEDLPADLHGPTPAITAGAHGNALETAERDALLRTIREHRGNMTRVAGALDISRNTLYRKLRQHGIAVGARR